jgi:hypothetical protein
VFSICGFASTVLPEKLPLKDVEILSRALKRALLGISRDLLSYLFEYKSMFIRIFLNLRAFHINTSRSPRGNNESPAKRVSQVF